ncbi:single stranded DNA-binding protein [Agrobacterium phage Atu_ph04]|uniref:Single-stranded DNA-binding protein n=1 Tax=Agrobacterium phage Atu_ph04 TaxID=2024263 RepID=A0A223VZM1_9CAUD|nr:single stranded DNA-binding protein [Agrobacterium phage Atu_ph04]ASV44613.1 single stranded DNA-binding protein [Agrobacterium phage Atu_ph04]
MSFSDLKKKMGNFDEIRQQLQDNSGSRGENAYLNFGIDQTRNAYVRGRLMPAPEGENSPMVTYSRFNWKNGSKSYFAFSLRNIGEKSDPCQEYLAKLWEDGSKEAKALYGERKKKTNTLVNFHVIEDKVDPSNNGKTWLLRTPAFIKGLIDKALNPPKDKFTGEQAEAFNPFDIFGTYGGRDLILRVHDKEGQNSYETSKFADTPSALYDGDEAKMKEAYEGCHSLYKFVDPSRYKTRDELIAILAEVLGRNDPYFRAAHSEWLEANPTATGSGSRSERSESREEKREEKKEEPRREQPKSEPKAETKTETQSKPSSDDDGDFDFNVDFDDTPFGD